MAVVLVLVALDYAIWSSSIAGGSDVAGTISGLTLPPLIAALLLLVAVNAMRGLGGATRRRPRPVSSRAPGDAGAPAIMGADTEEQATAASSRASSPKIAA